MKLKITKSGGLVGLSSETEIETDELSNEEFEGFEEINKKSDIDEQLWDGFVYTIQVEGSQDSELISVSESRLNPKMLAFIKLVEEKLK